MDFRVAIPRCCHGIPEYHMVSSIPFSEQSTKLLHRTCVGLYFKKRKMIKQAGVLAFLMDEKTNKCSPVPLMTSLKIVLLGGTNPRTWTYVLILCMLTSTSLIWVQYLNLFFGSYDHRGLIKQSTSLSLWQDNFVTGEIKYLPASLSAFISSLFDVPLGACIFTHLSTKPQCLSA